MGRRSEEWSVFYDPNAPDLVKERSQQLATAIERERIVRNAQLQQEAKATTVEQERQAFIAEMERKGRVPHVFLDNAQHDGHFWTIELDDPSGEVGILYHRTLAGLYGLFVNPERIGHLRRLSILPRSAVSSLVGKC